MNIPENRRRAVSNLFASFLPALVSLPLCFAAGCGVEESDATATEHQALGAGCLLRRPLAWSGVGATCVESQSKRTSIPMNDGDSYFTTSVPGPGLGQGEITLFCRDGQFVPDPWDKICIPSHGGGGGQEP